MTIDFIESEINEIQQKLDGLTTMLGDVREHTSTVKQTAVFLAGIEPVIKDLTKFTHRMSDSISELKQMIAQHGLMIELVDGRVKLIDDRMNRSEAEKATKKNNDI